MANRNIYTAERIFTGDEWLVDTVVIAEDGWIKDVIPVTSLPAETTLQRFDDCIIAPAFIDLQLYGAYGKLLAVYPEADSLHKINDYCLKGGAALCLPTVATNTYDVFHQCIDAVRKYWQEGGKGIAGLHLEGPWINPVKRGAHIQSLIHSPTAQQVKDLLTYGKDVIKMITLAPEVCSSEIIAMILQEGIIISAGHSNATYEEAKQGFASGITTVTHLYNAMSPLQHRQPGLVGAVMDDDAVMASIIPDGHHVDYAAIRIAKAVMKERLFVITDAVTDTTEGYYPHQLAGDKYEAGGVLSGSSLQLNQAVKNLVTHAGIELGEALRMCSRYPARVIGWENRMGKIAAGFQVPMLAMDTNFVVKEVLY